MPNEKTIGREPITIVEIEQDFCKLSYGDSPCTAAIGTTGTHKCFNTFKTCQDSANYDKSSLVLRFTKARSNYPVGEYMIPSLISVSNNPTEISIGSSDPDSRPLGRNASVNLVFQDHPHNDKFVDPYRLDRDYDPKERSTFWAKWLMRNPYYQNRPLRIIEGYVGQEISEMRTRHYIIQRIDGPDSNGKVKIVAQDILKRAEDKRAQCPLPNTGKLLNDILDDATGLTLTPSGIGNSEYPASGVAIIGSEIVSYTRSGDAITFVERALRGTDAQDHDAGETFQQVKVYTNERVDYVIYDLLTEFANIESSYIPLSEWNAEAGTYLAGFLLNAWITEPLGVSQLLSEIVQQCSCYFWWDEVQQKIPLKAIRPLVSDETAIREINASSHIIADSFKIERKTGERISQIWFRFAQYDPTESLQRASNFRRLSINIDSQAEQENEYGESRIKEIHSRFFDDSNGGAASTTATRLITRYRDDPIYYTFKMDAKDRDVLVGDVIKLKHPSLVDETGKPREDVLQVVKVTELEAGHILEYKCQAFGFALAEYGVRYAFITDNSAPDYDAATDNEKNTGAWICEDDGFFDDGTDGYRIV